MVKKSFYEMLGVSPQATDADIKWAYQSKIEQLKADAARMGHEEFEFELKILKMAFVTLTDAQARSAYDARLASGPQPSMDRAAASQGNAIPPMPVAALTNRVDVLSLRADAMALRAEAIATKLDIGDDMPLMAKQTRWSPAMKLGLLVMMAIVGFFAVRMASNYFMLQQVVQIRQDAALAEEKVIIQEYYLTHGVRPASAAEARLLQAQRESEEREQHAAERAQQRQEERQRGFVEDARRIGDRVSADLQRAEEQKEQRAMEERQRIESERSRQENEEQERVRRQQEQWDRVLGR